jgi:hypothetical protein
MTEGRLRAAFSNCPQNPKDLERLFLQPDPGSIFFAQFSRVLVDLEAPEAN